MSTVFRRFTSVNRELGYSLSFGGVTAPPLYIEEVTEDWRNFQTTNRTLEIPSWENYAKCEGCIAIICKLKLLVSFFLIVLLLFTCGVQDGFAREKKKGVKEVEKETPYQKLFKGKTCETVKGLLTIHKMDGKVYFEIPRSLLEKDMLLGSTISETTNNLFGSVGEKPTDPLCVQFTQTDTVISLRQVNHGYTTELVNVAQRIRESMKPAVMYNSGILAYNPDSTAVVVEMTEFFLRDDEQLTPFSAYAPATWGGRWIVKEFKKDNSQLGRIKAFEDNVSVQSSLSYEVNLRDGRYYYIYKLPFTSLMTRSFILLPEEPMRPRMADPRIGIFYQGVSDFRNGDSGLKNIYYAQRWRLEPSDETAFRMGQLVEPKKPIVFYVDNAFPESWKKYIKAGVEEWKDAFERIGFKNAIVAKDFPVNDPEFDPDNVKFSCVRYSPSQVANAMGPSWTDPRTGEILNASVYLYHNLIQLVHDWRFLQTSPADPDARKVCPVLRRSRPTRYVRLRLLKHTEQRIRSWIMLGIIILLSRETRNGE